jgi:triosephosphate isomerase
VKTEPTRTKKAFVKSKMSTTAAAARRIFIGGNWKCNPSTKAAVQTLTEMLNSAPSFPSNCQVVVCPTNLHMGLVQEKLKREDVELGVQNIWKDSKAGAWTGELTCDIVKDFGAKWVVLGHSERRHTVSHENSELIGEKVATALKAGLSVIACVGEQLSERKAGTTMDVVMEQLAPIVSAVTTANAGDAWNDRLVIAYEPVWAIGTGVVATPEQAQETHQNIRQWLKGKIGEQLADKTRIIYGGSVNAANCQDLMKREDIDGFLVGGASLKPEFLNIVASATLKAKM